MKIFVDATEIYLHRDSVYFQKQINGLKAIVELDMKRTLHTRAMFLFCSKRRNKLKLLYWEKTGFCLWYKRLENDKFKWPKKHELKTINIGEEQLYWVLRGFDIRAMKAHDSINLIRFISIIELK
jgi:transposase